MFFKKGEGVHDQMIKKCLNMKFFPLRTLILAILSVFLLNACSILPNQQSSLKVKTHKQNSSNPELHWKLPIRIPDGEFFKIGGWLSNDKLLYITNKQQTSNLFSYDLKTGKSQLIFKSSDPIGDVLISPEKDFILIQASPSSYEGKITVIDVKGTEKFTQLIPSHEIEMEWNPYKESEILISKFNEDWTFQVSLVNFKEKIIKQLSIPQPFLKWVNKDKIAYLNWQGDSQTLSAPLVTHSLTTGKDQLLFQKVYQFSTYPDRFLAITINESDKTKAVYSFYDKKLHPIFSFKIPQLTKYSDWLVPYSDYLEKNQLFFTFKPLRSTSEDSYSEGFDLVSYDLKNGKSTTILNGMDNEPILLSPNGDASLYGNRFERIINLKTKKITELVKE
jgi:hypothetical protein